MDPVAGGWAEVLRRDYGALGKVLEALRKHGPGGAEFRWRGFLVQRLPPVLLRRSGDAQCDHLLEGRRGALDNWGEDFDASAGSGPVGTVMARQIVGM